MFLAVRRALTQFLTDPRLWLVLAASAFVSLLAFAGLWWGVREGVAWVAGHWPKYAGWLKYGQGTLGFITALLLFPTLFILVASLFQEKWPTLWRRAITRELPKADGAPLKSSILAAIRFFLLMITVNVIALPFYLALLWLAGSGAVLMLLVNGLLAGREYYEITAPPPDEPAGYGCLAPEKPFVVFCGRGRDRGGRSGAGFELVGACFGHRGDGACVPSSEGLISPAHH